MLQLQAQSALPPGVWCRRSKLQLGKRAEMALATATLASSIISSTMELVSSVCMGRQAIMCSFGVATTILDGDWTHMQLNCLKTYGKQQVQAGMSDR
jgi:hypothetical protein